MATGIFALCSFAHAARKPQLLALDQLLAVYLRVMIANYCVKYKLYRLSQLPDFTERPEWRASPPQQAQLAIEQHTAPARSRPASPTRPPDRAPALPCAMSWKRGGSRPWRRLPRRGLARCHSPHARSDRRPRGCTPQPRDHGAQGSTQIERDVVDNQHVFSSGEFISERKRLLPTTSAAGRRPSRPIRARTRAERPRRRGWSSGRRSSRRTWESPERSGVWHAVVRGRAQGGPAVERGGTETRAASVEHAIPLPRCACCCAALLMTGDGEPPADDRQPPGRSGVWHDVVRGRAQGGTETRAASVEHAVPLPRSATDQPRTDRPPPTPTTDRIRPMGIGAGPATRVTGSGRRRSRRAARR